MLYSIFQRIINDFFTIYYGATIKLEVYVTKEENILLINVFYIVASLDVVSYHAMIRRIGITINLPAYRDIYRG